jgi:hypothetical protein
MKYPFAVSTIFKSNSTIFSKLIPIKNRLRLLINRSGAIFFAFIIMATATSIQCSGYKEKKEIKNITSQFIKFISNKDKDSINKMYIEDINNPTNNLYTGDWPGFKDSEISDIELKNENEAVVEIQWKQDGDILNLEMNVFKQNKEWKIAPEIKYTAILKNK